jgi:hypothetical protein
MSEPDILAAAPVLAVIGLAVRSMAGVLSGVSLPPRPRDR